jgi:hypothetical protein
LEDRKVEISSQSGYIGVHPYRNKFVAKIGLGGGQQKYLGIYTDPVEAAEAYGREARLLRGVKAVTNFPLKNLSGGSSSDEISTENEVWEEVNTKVDGEVSHRAEHCLTLN